MGLGLSSFWQALNEYFDKKRGRATGIALSVCGFGPILMPQLTIFLMSVYGIQGTMLILGAITSHTLAAALLLQPVKWHMKVAMVERQEGVVEKKPQLSTEGTQILKNSRRRCDFVSFAEDSLLNHPPVVPNLDYSIVEGSEEVGPQEPRSKSKEIVSNIISLLDLSILKDKIFVNILVGIALETFAEANFSVLTPFILGDLGLSNATIATFMSLTATIDIVVRFLSPFIADRFKLSTRDMSMICMVVLIVGRQS